MSKTLEGIEEEKAGNWLSATCPPPETPTESMEFLARAWSLPAAELSKALCKSNIATDDVDDTVLSSPGPIQVEQGSSLITKENMDAQTLPTPDSPPVSPRGSDDAKDLLLLHQALNSDLPTSQQLMRNGLYRSIMRKKTKSKWLKDQKDRKRHEVRTHNAQLHAAVSVAGVAAAVAALVASSVTSSEKSNIQQKTSAKSATAIASAAALVASHCIEIAEDMGADHEEILSVVNSAINARTNGDIMTLTAGAATALRGAATLRARLDKVHGARTISLAEENFENTKELNASDFVSRGGELLKRTRKGDLHWKQVSFNINSNCQVVAKLKSKHMGGTFTKKKKFVVKGISSDIPAWPGREGRANEQKAYFAIETADRSIEFECRNKRDKQIWVEGIKCLLHLQLNMY